LFINGTRQRSMREAIILRETVKIAEYLYRFYFRLIQYIIEYGVLFYDIKIHLRRGTVLLGCNIKGLKNRIPMIISHNNYVRIITQ